MQSWFLTLDWLIESACSVTASDPVILPTTSVTDERRGQYGEKDQSHPFDGVPENILADRLRHNMLA